MGDDGAAVGDEVLGRPLSLRCLGFDAENLEARGVAVAQRGDGGTTVSSKKATVQRQAVVGIHPIAAMKGCMDGIDGLLDLIGGSSLLGTFCDRHRCAVEHPLVAVGVDVQPGWWRESHSDFFKPGQKQPADLLFVGHPLAEGCRHGAGMLSLDNLLSLVGIFCLNRPEPSVDSCWGAIKNGVEAHHLIATSHR